jgi:HSP20 family protein
MSLIKFKPQNSLWDPFDNFFNDFFEGEFIPRNVARNFNVPAANVKEVDNAFHIELAAPGMNKKDFKVEVEDDVLTIRAEHKDEKEETKERYTKREFNYASFTRSFRLPEHVKSDKIKAKYDNGILTLDIPKAEEVTHAKVREISIS